MQCKPLEWGVLQGQRAGDPPNRVRGSACARDRGEKVDQKGQFWTHPPQPAAGMGMDGHRSPIRAGARQAAARQRRVGLRIGARTRSRGRGSWTQPSGRATGGSAWTSSSSVPRKARRGDLSAAAEPPATRPLGEPLIGPFQQLNYPAACVEERSEFRRPSNLLLV